MPTRRLTPLLALACAIDLASVSRVAGQERQDTPTVRLVSAVTSTDAARPADASTETEASETAATVTSEDAGRREWLGGPGWLQWSRMTGDWASWRASLERRGLTFLLGATVDSSRAVGSDSAATARRGLLDLGAELDLSRAGLGAGRLFVGYLEKGGGEGADCVEEGQGFSNIDAPDFRHVGEVWYERELGSRLRIKAGIQDANAEFAFVENGGEFLNASMGYSPTIFPMPTYPEPQLGLVVQSAPTSWSYLGTGLYNAGAAVAGRFLAAVFSVVEGGLRWDRAGGGRVGLGYWRLDASSTQQDDARVATGAAGRYVVVDQTLWTDGRGERARRVAAFFQGGWTGRSLCPVGEHLGAGVVAAGVVPGRPTDRVGAAITTVAFRDAATGADTGRELNIGAFYKLTLAGWLALKPDLQVIHHPGGDERRPTTAAATLRLEFIF